MSFNKPNIIKFDSVLSTNDKMSELCENNFLPEFTVVMTENQTAGKGQVGNGWESEAGKNLTFSILCKPNFIPINKQFKITQIITCAIIKVLKPIINDVCIKWPNDIYCGDKKIAGILVENSLRGSQIETSIIGVGLNVNQTIFVSNAPNPSSLKILTNQDYDIDNLLDKILFNFIDLYIDLMNNNIDKMLKENYMENLYRKDSFHNYCDSNGLFSAKVFDVLSSGHLILETETSEHRKYAFKEVSFVM